MLRATAVAKIYKTFSMYVYSNAMERFIRYRQWIYEVKSWLYHHQMVVEICTEVGIYWKHTRGYFNIK